MKRTQKDSEGESTGGAPSAVNDMSSEMRHLSDPAQGLFTPEGNIVSSVIGKLETEARNRWPIRITHVVNQATSEALEFLEVP